MKRKVEFIESYIKVGNDYQWNDNHGELIRCRDCKNYGTDGNRLNCNVFCCSMPENGFCSMAEPKEKVNGK